MFQKNKSIWAGILELLAGVLFVWLAFMALANPAGSLFSLVIVYGIGAIILGIGSIIRFILLEKRTGFASAAPLLLGIIDIIAGLLLLFNQVTGTLVLVWMFPIWLLVTGLMGLATGGLNRVYGKGYYWLNIVVNLLLIVASIFLFADPLSSALTLSFSFAMGMMFFGIKSIVAAISLFLRRHS